MESCASGLFMLFINNNDYFFGSPYTPNECHVDLLQQQPDNLKIHQVHKVADISSPLAGWVVRDWSWVYYTSASDLLPSKITSEVTCSGGDQKEHKISASLAYVREFNGDRWFPAQRTSNADNVSIWWRHHEKQIQHNSNAYSWLDRN